MWKNSFIFSCSSAPSLYLHPSNISIYFHLNLKIKKIKNKIYDTNEKTRKCFQRIQKSLIVFHLKTPLNKIFSLQIFYKVKFDNIFIKNIFNENAISKSVIKIIIYQMFIYETI